jgi:hypothetical protein
MNPEAVVVTFNSAAHIRPCLASLGQSGARTVVVDNGSHDETLNIVRAEFPEVQLVSAGENLGYGKALNLGIAKTGCAFVLAANADTVFPEGSLQALAKFLQEHPEVGVAGPQQLFPDGSWQRSYGEVPSIYEAIKTLIGVTSLSNIAQHLLWRHLPARSAKRVGYVDGAVMMIRRTVFDEIGGFDENFHYYGEDADLCLRLRKKGWGVVRVPKVQVTHVRGGSSTKVEGHSDKLLRLLVRANSQLLEKHYPSWQTAPYLRICRMHARKMMLIYRLFQIFSSSSSAPRASVLALAFEREARIWTELKS